jgi:hypothetical protein
MLWKTKECVRTFLDTAVAFDKTSPEAKVTATKRHAAQHTSYRQINWILESRNIITTVMGDTLKKSN